MSRAPFSTCNSCPLIVTLTNSAAMFLKRCRSPDREFERVRGRDVGADLERVLPAFRQFALEVLRAVEDGFAALREESHRGAVARGEVRRELLPRACAEVVLVHRAEPNRVLDDGGRAPLGEPDPLGDDAVCLP